jgi:GDP-4-dehydro-6-deoxy-D-mannose reductase
MAIDILDRDAVRQAVRDARPTAVYHLAGIAHVGGSWDRTAQTLEVNVLGTHHLLDAVAGFDPAVRVLITGSALVYREQTRALGEDDPIGPASPYGLSKLAQEMAGAHAAREQGVPVLLTRPFSHVGPRQSPSFFASGVARQVARIEQGLEEPVIGVGNLDAQRDLTDVRDTVRAYQAILDRGVPARVYNVCSGQAYRVGDILESLLSRARVRIGVRQDPERYRPHDAPLVLGDRHRLSRELGWIPTIPIGQTLSDLLEYWRRETRTARPASAAGGSPL